MLVLNEYSMNAPSVVFYDEEKDLQKTAEIVADAFSSLTGTAIPVTTPLRGPLLDQDVESAVHVCFANSNGSSSPRFEFVDAHRREAMSRRSDGDCYSGIAVTGWITDRIISLARRWLGKS